VSRGEPSKKRNEYAAQARVLIADNSNDSVCAKKSRNARGCLALINCFDSEVSSELLEPLVDETITLLPHDCTEWNAARGDRSCRNFPIAVVSRHEYHTAAK
jgi:hypothetical protein